MDASQYRIAALTHANERHARAIDALRGDLTVQWDKQASLLTARVTKVEQINREEEVIMGYQDRVADMTGGTQGFSIELLNQCVLYIGIVTDRKRAMVAELAQLESEIGDVESKIAWIQREIASKTQRIDQCDEQIAAVRHAIDLAREDAQDEESEEMATTRFIRENVT